MRPCETCGAPTEASWTEVMGMGKEHGVACLPCAEDYAKGLGRRVRRPVEDLTPFDLPIYPDERKSPTLESIGYAECTMCGLVRPRQTKWDSDTPGSEDRHFCGEECWLSFGEWAVWQKDLGNGIDSEFNGSSPVGGSFRPKEVQP